MDTSTLNILKLISIQQQCKTNSNIPSAGVTLLKPLASLVGVSIKFVGQVRVVLLFFFISFHGQYQDFPALSEF